jgi:hypothetical protein
MVVTSKLILPNRLFIGEGMEVEVQESAGRIDIPAAAAVESFINSRLESLSFFLSIAMAG